LCSFSIIQKQSNRSAASNKPELYIHGASDGNEKDSFAFAAIAHFSSITRFVRLQKSWVLTKSEHVSKNNFSSEFIDKFSSIETAKVRQGRCFCQMHEPFTVSDAPKNDLYRGRYQTILARFAPIIDAGLSAYEIPLRTREGK
jgi:hypothetical protein